MSDPVNQGSAPEIKILHCALCDTDFDVSSNDFMHIGRALSKRADGENKKVCPECTVKIQGVLDIHEIPPASFWSSLSEVLKDADLPALYSDMRRAYDNYDRPIEPNSAEIQEGFNEQGLAAVELFRSRFDYKHFLELCREWYESDYYLLWKSCGAKLEATDMINALNHRIDEIPSSQSG